MIEIWLKSLLQIFSLHKFLLFFLFGCLPFGGMEAESRVEREMIPLISGA